MFLRVLTLALAFLISLSTATVLLRDELLIEGDHIFTNDVPAHVTLLHVSRKTGGAADLRSLLESSTLLGTGSPNGIHFIPLGTQYDHLSAHVKTELIQSAFVIYIKGIELEKFAASIWYHELLGEEDLARRFESRMAQHSLARKDMLRNFQDKFEVSYYDVPFFGQRREIRVSDGATESFPTSYQVNIDEKRRALSAARIIYLTKLKLDKIVAVCYRVLYTGHLTTSAVQAELIAQAAKQLRSTIDKYKVSFGISYYDAPYFGYELSVLEGKIKPKTDSDSEENNDPDEDNEEDSEEDSDMGAEDTQS